MTIYVQIASYRDPQLIPTIKSLLENSKYPKNLRVGIARQFHPNDKFDDLSEYENDERFRILNIPYEESLGVCWARHLVQQLYDNEEYTLQIDSHMRFERNWDETLINMLEELKKDGNKKPLLTAYVSSFNPENDSSDRVMVPWRMVFDKFTPEGVVFFLPEVIPNWKQLDKPIPSRFYSAHFCFTIGQFALEVQHDPEFYFHGEEISIAARAYTHGYDLFHPHKVIVWHEYTRKGRTKHWDDIQNWSVLNKESHRRNRVLFGMDDEIKNIDFGRFGFGKLRTLKEYEKYSGILFERRAVQQYTLDKKYPPNPYTFNNENEWKNSFASKFKYDIKIPKINLKEKDYEFFAIAFHDKKDETLYRKDADKLEIFNSFKAIDDFITIRREFNNEQIPAYWVVWPYSKTKGWCDRLVGQI
jgi:hypothetical protein